MRAADFQLHASGLGARSGALLHVIYIPRAEPCVILAAANLANPSVPFIDEQDRVSKANLAVPRVAKRPTHELRQGIGSVVMLSIRESENLGLELSQP